MLFPEATEMLYGNKEFRSSGGWMLGLAESLIATGKIELVVAAVSTVVNVLTNLKGKKIAYYIIPLGQGNTRENKEYRQYWKQIYSEVRPDIVHIHGTEFSHGLAYMQELGVDKVVVSIQGLLALCAENYCAGLTKHDIFLNLTPRDILRGSIWADQRRFYQRSKYELKILDSAKHIIGRTCWDKLHTQSINPSAEYYFCNEVLRTEFYCDDIWKYGSCIPHTIFISQAGYPLKGFHQVLKAMPMILSKYPDTRIRVAGPDITKCKTLYDFLHLTGYGLYLKRMIIKYGLEDKVIFLGPLTAPEMKDEYLKSNVFVCPSSIENSPNSLAEAQILGVPCVASRVGGIPDMMKGNEDNLYNFDDIEVLAGKILRVFQNGNKQVDTRSIALNRHHRPSNIGVLLSIYTKILHN